MVCGPPDLRNEECSKRDCEDARDDRLLLDTETSSLTHQTSFSGVGQVHLESRFEGVVEGTPGPGVFVAKSRRFIHIRSNKQKFFFSSDFRFPTLSMC